MNKSRIDKYLLEKTNKLVFISLDEKLLDKIELLKEYKNIEYPVFSEVLLAMASDDKIGINTKDIVSAMIYILGIDANFKYSKTYKEIIEKLTKEPLLAASNLAGEAYKDKQLLDSLIFSRGYNSCFKKDKNLMFNYALLCQEISNQAVEEGKKTDFILEAESVFKYLTQVYPEFAIPYYHLAYYMLKDNDIENAQLYFAKSIELGMDKEFMEDAKTNLKKIVLSEKLSLAIDNVENQDYLTSIELLNEVLKDDENSYEANFYLGYINRLQGEYESAIDYYEVSYKQNSSDSNLINEMALCFAHLGDFEQSLELLEYAYELKPESIEILCNLAMVNFNMENLDEAKSYIKKAEDIDNLDDIVQACIKVIYKEDEEL